jgi:DNA-directed RNA polymerase delta subunit
MNSKTGTDSILNMIKEAEKTTKTRSFNAVSEAEYLLTAPKIKKARDIEVINKRFGLDGNKPQTLEEIGRSLEITRERVRQIEANALRKLKEFAINDFRGQEIGSTLISILKSSGFAVTQKDILVQIFGLSPTTKEKHSLDLLTTVIQGIDTVKETHDLKSGFIVEPIKLTFVNELIKKAVNVLELKQIPIEEEALIGELLPLDPNISKTQVVAFLSFSKLIIKTDTGHLGLSHWREINPKSIKDKTYYILKKHNKPLHYKEISDHIQKIDKNAKQVTRQAVHNELIRDERFILIGRGIYALKEWGYKSGVVEKVIEEVLIKADRPMHKDEIVVEVQKLRIVKETTILLNLQRDKFKRISRATYTVNRGE